MNKSLGKFSEVELREYWEDEARDFTPWLAKEENLNELGKAIGIELELEGIETRTGSYKADILAKEAGTDNYVIIENQLERTNHDHLGKLITYASGHNAKIIVWIAKEINEDHRKALDWLNEVSAEDIFFFGIELELSKIDNSNPALKFKVISKPNEWAKSIKSSTTTQEPTETKMLQLDFWKGFVDYCNKNKTLFSMRKPRPQHWYTLAIGRSRFRLSLTANTRINKIGCALHISHADAKKAFTLLKAEKSQIEKEVGAELDWQELPLKRDCRIIQQYTANIDEQDKWNEYFKWLKERAESFYKVFSNRVRELELEDIEEAEEEEELAQTWGQNSKNEEIKIKHFNNMGSELKK